MYHHAPIIEEAKAVTRTECRMIQLQATTDTPVSAIVHGWHLTSTWRKKHPSTDWEINSLPCLHSMCYYTEKTRHNGISSSRRFNLVYFSFALCDIQLLLLDYHEGAYRGQKSKQKTRTKKCSKARQLTPQRKCEQEPQDGHRSYAFSMQKSWNRRTK